MSEVLALLELSLLKSTANTGVAGSINPEAEPRASNANLSGMPPEFEQWCKTSWLPANLGRDYYRKQAEAHIDSLATRIANLQRQIEEQAGGLLDERDRLIQQRLWLQNELDNVAAG